jgi:predicted transglutaminase-like cysteine proteinase
MDDAEALLVLKAANCQVNAALIPTGGISAVGRSDYWSLPINGRCDCKHHALLKTKTLIANGCRADRLAVTVVLDRNGSNHAVLMARLNAGDYVLDNLTGRIRSWDDTGYTFLARQNFQNQRKWEVILVGPRAGTFDGI